jgi:hypothetical protein
MAYKTVSMKSIAMAREENRKILREHDDRDSWKHYPDDKPKPIMGASPERTEMPAISSPGPPQKDSSHKDDLLHHRRSVREQGLTAPTHLSEERKTWGERHGEVKGGAANYYKSVKVCGVCAQVYSLLDQAREIMYAEEEKKSEEVRPPMHTHAPSKAPSPSPPPPPPSIG